LLLLGLYSSRLLQLQLLLLRVVLLCLLKSTSHFLRLKRLLLLLGMLLRLLLVTRLQQSVLLKLFLLLGMLLLLNRLQMSRGLVTAVHVCWQLLLLNCCCIIHLKRLNTAGGGDFCSWSCDCFCRKHTAAGGAAGGGVAGTVCSCAGDRWVLPALAAVAAAGDSCKQTAVTSTGSSVHAECSCQPSSVRHPASHTRRCRRGSSGGIGSSFGLPALLLTLVFGQAPAAAATAGLICICRCVCRCCRAATAAACRVRSSRSLLLPLFLDSSQATATAAAAALVYRAAVIPIC
jgi:hypothetical protein